MSPRTRRLAFGYVFAVYLAAATSETLISPLFPLIRGDLHLRVAQQGQLLLALTIAIGVGNIVGGAVGHRRGDTIAIRCAAGGLALGSFLCASATTFRSLLVGQLVLGIGSGLFFGPGLSVVGRTYAESRGRAVASYGLAYSGGLAVAALAANLGQSHWRIAFIATGALAASVAVAAPTLLEADRAHATPMWGSFVTSLGRVDYRMALATGIVAGIINYIAIGFAPTLFVDEGIGLPTVATLIGAGRLVSAVGKYLGGWMFDRFGGFATACGVMGALTVLGVPMVLIPHGRGVVLLVPFVTVSAVLFTVSNIMSVSGGPSRSSFGTGVYRSVLVTSAAVMSGVATLALAVVSLHAVVLGACLIPLFGCAGVAWSSSRRRRV